MKICTFLFRESIEGFVACVFEINAGFQLRVQPVIDVISRLILADSLKDTAGAVLTGGCTGFPLLIEAQWSRFCACIISSVFSLSRLCHKSV